MKPAYENCDCCGAMSTQLIAWVSTLRVCPKCAETLDLSERENNRQGPAEAIEDIRRDIRKIMGR